MCSLHTNNWQTSFDDHRFLFGVLSIFTQYGISGLTIKRNSVEIRVSGFEF
jgi:hypothetical protein